jgi:hypothetical protein
MRPITLLAAENGVGELAAHEAPNASMGKRASSRKYRRETGRKDSSTVLL